MYLWKITLKWQKEFLNLIASLKHPHTKCVTSKSRFLKLSIKSNQEPLTKNIYCDSQLATLCDVSFDTFDLTFRSYDRCTGSKQLNMSQLCVPACWRQLYSARLITLLSLFTQVQKHSISTALQRVSKLEIICNTYEKGLKWWKNMFYQSLNLLVTT